jgi:hypothetical protein
MELRWNDGDRGKVLIRPPELSGNPTRNQIRGSHDGEDADVFIPEDGE